MQPELNPIELSVSDFVELLNQTLEFAYPSVVITGELANFRVSKNRWVYFDLKDEAASVKFFGTVYQLPGPLEDGLLLKVRGQPRLHSLYGFSVNVINMQPAGEGSIRRTADLLRAKLTVEGLFDESRKRSLPYPPTRIGLITSRQSAAYADFIKILHARWGGLEIQLIDVQVQGEPAASQIIAALEQLNAEADPPEVITIIRGGGSAEDLAAFNTEQVTRAVAASRVPTLVAIGHEIDLSLAELAADRRASTPSNAAELLVPDRRAVRRELEIVIGQLENYGQRHIQAARSTLQQQLTGLEQAIGQLIDSARRSVDNYDRLLNALDPASILRRGYSIIRWKGTTVRTIRGLTPGVIVEVQLAEGGFGATVSNVNSKKRAV